MATHQVEPGTVAGKGKRKAAAKPVEEQKVPEITAEQREAERRDGERREAERRAQAQSDAAMAFATTQLSKGPELAAPPALVNEYQQKLAELQKQYNIPATQAKTSGNKDVRNGITRPGENTTTGKVWAAADRLTIAKGRPAAIAELKLDAALIGVNDHTLKTQYARWRQFNDVKGRINVANVPTKVMTHEGNP